MRRILFDWARNIFALLGLFLSIWIPVWPRVYVHPLESLDPNNPMFAPFVVRNEGYLAIRDVKFSCKINYLARPGGPLVIGMGENRFSDPTQVSTIIAPGREVTELLPLLGMEHNQWPNADIEVRLEFKPWQLLPYERKEMHRFVVMKKGDRWLWCPQPVNK
jgi:hypothetical protein